MKSHRQIRSQRANVAVSAMKVESGMSAILLMTVASAIAIRYQVEFASFIASSERETLSLFDWDLIGRVKKWF